MSNTNEILRPIEQGASTSFEEAHEGGAITPVRAAEILCAREEMLVSVRPLIHTPLYETLLRKINHEYASLLVIFQEESTITETRKKMNRTLKSEYFIQKRLEIGIF